MRLPAGAGLAMTDVTFDPPFRRLFPDDVVACALAPGARTPPLPPEEAVAVERAVAARRREFAAGRTCARRALERLGVPAPSIPRGPDRAPVWPEGVLGSISHKDGACGVVVCSRDDRVGIGFDLERREELASSLWRIVLTDEERRFLEGRDPQERGTLARVVFAAKESLYKAQHSFSRTFVGFREVSLTPDPDRGVFAATLLRDVAPGLPAGHLLTGRFQMEGEWIHAGIVLRRADLA